MGKSFAAKFNWCKLISNCKLHLSASPKDMSANPSLDQTKAKALVDFVSWAITDGQKLAPKLGYVLLPPEVVKHNQDTLKSITFKGTPLYTGP